VLWLPGCQQSSEKILVFEESMEKKTFNWGKFLICIVKGFRVQGSYLSVNLDLSLMTFLTQTNHLHGWIEGCKCPSALGVGRL
jgi:hypothetical protein